MSETSARKYEAAHRRRRAEQLACGLHKLSGLHRLRGHNSAARSRLDESDADGLRGDNRLSIAGSTGGVTTLGGSERWLIHDVGRSNRWTQQCRGNS
jgi:hypothetical protein